MSYGTHQKSVLPQENNHDKQVRQAYHNNCSSMSFYELKIAFEKLQNKAEEAFKIISSDKQIFSFLEGKVYKSQKYLKCLKASIVESSKDNDVRGCIP